MARKLMLKNNPEFLEKIKRMYVNEKMTMQQIGNIYNVSAATILYHLRRNGVETRKNGYWMIGRKLSQEHIEIISKTHKGKMVSPETRRKMSETRTKLKLRSPNWKGGKRTGRTDQYIQVYVPDHPYASKEGYVMEHRLVMEKKLGRYLKPTEVVHHKNGKRNDNRPENLRLFSGIGEHTSYHCRKRKGEIA